MYFKRKGSIYVPDHEGIRRYAPADAQRYKRHLDWREHQRTLVLGISFDATASSHFSSSSSSLTYSHTCGQGANALHVGVTFFTLTQTITSITYAGVALTRAVQHSYNGFNNEGWYLKAPAIGANNVVITLSGNISELNSGSVSMSGVNQTTPVGTSNSSHGGSGDSPTVNITTNATDYVLCTYAAVSNRSQSSPAGATRQWTFFGVVDIGGYGSTQNATGTTTTLTWDASSDWVLVGVPFIAAPPAANKLSRFLMMFPV